MKKRAAGLGTVRQLPPAADGTPRFQALTPRLPNKRRTSLGVFPTYEGANEMRAATVQNLAKADLSRVPGTSLRAFGVRRLDELEVDGDHCISHRRSRWGHIVEAPFIDDPIDTIARPVVVAWIKTLQQKRVRRGRGPGAKLRPIAANTVRGVVSELVQVFDAALDEGIATVNPVRGIRKRRAKTDHADDDAAEVWTYLDGEEQARLRDCAAIPEADRLIILFAIGTGLRQGEQFNLELRDLHVDGPNPRVFVRWGSKGRKPKNGKTRTVPLFGVGLAVARRWLQVLPTYARKNPERLVFPLPTGTRRRPSRHLQRGGGNRIDGFRLALAAAGIKRHVRWHDLRHTCAASCVSGTWGQQWRLEDVKEILGHASIRITERYAHLAPAAISDLAARTRGLPMEHAPRAIDGRTSPEAIPSYGSCWGTTSRTIPAGNGTGAPSVAREAAIGVLLRLGAQDGVGAEREAEALLGALRAERMAVDADVLLAVALGESPREGMLHRLAEAVVVATRADTAKVSAR